MRKNDQRQVIVICGPTGSGKSDLAFELARLIGGEVVSADSMQIYREMDIGTAKVSQQEQAIVKHHMLDIIEPTASYSVADYSQQASKVLEDICNRGVWPIVCGGTGQYINALLDGLIFFDIEIDPKLRAEITDLIQPETSHYWHKELAKLDPQAGHTIKATDLRRIRRFFEVFRASKMTRTELNEKSRAKGPDFNFIAFYLKPDRQALYHKINNRVERMFQLGLKEEVAGLICRYPNIEQCQSFQAIGYKESLALVKGEKSQSEVIDTISRVTRNYAKRQFTWFNARKDMKHLDNLSREDSLDLITNYLL